MRHLDPNWADFIDAITIYKRLSVKARREFIEHGPYSQPVPAHIFGGSLSEFVTIGIFGPAASGRSIVLAPRFRGFVKALRAMHRSRIDTQPNAASFDAYLADNFTREEWSALNGNYRTYGRDALYSKIASLQWIEDFLSSTSLKGGSQYSLLLDSSPPEEETQTHDLKRLVKYLMVRTEPVAFEELPKVFVDRQSLAWSIATGLRLALFYPMLQRETLEPTLGLWPQITKRLHRPALKDPQPATPVKTFCAAVHMDEMVAILTACIAEPLRLKAYSYNELFQKSEKRVAARFMQIPDWTTEFLRITNYRFGAAIGRLQDMSMLTLAGEPGVDHRLEVTSTGRAWLGSAPAERLKTLLDRVRNRKRQKQDYYSYEWDDLAPEIRIHGELVQSAKALREALARIPLGSHIRLKDFLAYESRAFNPLLDTAKERSLFRVTIGKQYLNEPSEDELEDAWSTVLREVLSSRLAPFAAIEVGMTEDKQITIALTEAGRYLLGLAESFSLPGMEIKAAIVVQPNFDIVFMAPSPLAEAELSSFTERSGSHASAVLKITKRSVWAAAAAGIISEHVLAALKAHSSVPVPANVEREIRGWMAQCRRAEIRQAVLIRCPDGETASRVVAADRIRLSKLTDTVVELSDPSHRSRLAKKLREMGIFV